MLPGDSEAIERRKVSRIASRLHVELRADAPDEFRRAAFRRKHLGKIITSPPSPPLGAVEGAKVTVATLGQNPF
jgi:hypothetical protein